LDLASTQSGFSRAAFEGIERRRFLFVWTQLGWQVNKLSALLGCSGLLGSWIAWSAKCGRQSVLGGRAGAGWQGRLCDRQKRHLVGFGWAAGLMWPPTCAVAGASALGSE